MITPFQSFNKKTGKYRYNGAWLIKYQAPDGTWRREVVGSSKKEAESKLRGILTDIERGTWVDPRAEKAKEKAPEGPQTWGDVLKMFRKAKYTHPDQKNSRSCLKYTLRVLENGIGDSGPLLPESTPISELTRERIREVYDAIGVSSLGTRTKNLRLTYIRIVFRWAAKHPAIPLDDLTAGLERFKGAGTRSKATDMKAVELDEVFTLEEIQKIVAYARKHYGTANATLLETAFASGMRKGELFGLKWVDVDFEKGLFSVRRNYDRRPKSGESRVVPIEPSLASTLKKWKAESPYSKEPDLVFPGPEGELRSEGYHWAKLVKNAADKAGVLRPGLKRFGHLTRHCFASHYLKAGGSDIMLARMLGHQGTDLIHTVYAHFVSDDLAADMARCGFSLGVKEEKKDVEGETAISSIHAEERTAE